LVGDTLAADRYTSAETVRDYARLLASESDRLRRLIDNLLSYASVTDVKQLYRFEPLCAASVVEQALARFDARLVAAGMDVDVALPDTLPRVCGDRNTLVQVFDIVIDNAIKYARSATTLAISGSVDEDMVTVAVGDQGPGIAAEELEHVFQKFYRGRGAASGGSGLGLAIARRTVHDHGGEIRLRSVEGQGTIVEISLPRIR
jgi:signal transduction histidine kinase